MKKVTRTAEKTRQYLSQHQNLIDFVNELHEYLKKHMRFYIGDDGGKYWGCGYNRPETDRVKLIKHFIKPIYLGPVLSLALLIFNVSSG